PGLARWPNIVPKLYLPVGVFRSPSRLSAENPARPICAAIAGKTARHVVPVFSKVCSVATSVVQLAEVTMTTCCALPTLANCCTSSGAGGGGAGFGGG